MITRTNWRQRMEQDMRPHDLRPRTVGGYLLAVRLFLERTGKAPEDATEEDVRSYVLHLRDGRLQAPSSVNIAVCALRFFFTHTLQRDYDVFSLRRVNKPPHSTHRQLRDPLGVPRAVIRRDSSVVSGLGGLFLLHAQARARRGG